jgi:AcrR family transcriptional regulator
MSTISTESRQPPSVRTRRPTGEVHRLILEAARSLFASKGYAGTTTREVAELAGVYEPMVYRRFGSKAKLFEAAVLVPFNEVISSYLATWESQGDTPATTEALVRAFVEPLYALFTEHRELILALVAAREFHADELDSDEPGLESALGQLLERLQPQLEIEAARRPLPDLDPPVTLLVSAGMIMGLALLEQTLHSGQKGLSRQRIVEEMVKFCLYGVTGRAGDDGAAAPVSPDVLALLDRVADAERRAIRAELELEHLTGRTRVLKDGDQAGRPAKSRRRRSSAD